MTVNIKTNFGDICGDSEGKYAWVDKQHTFRMVCVVAIAAAALWGGCYFQSQTCGTARNGRIPRGGPSSTTEAYRCRKFAFALEAIDASAVCGHDDRTAGLIAFGRQKSARRKKRMPLYFRNTKTMHCTVASLYCIIHCSVFVLKLLSTAV